MTHKRSPRYTEHIRPIPKIRKYMDPNFDVFHAFGMGPSLTRLEMQRGGNVGDIVNCVLSLNLGVMPRESSAKLHYCVVFRL